MVFRRTDTFSWRCINERGESCVIKIGASKYIRAYKKLIKYCDERNLIPVEYIGWEEGEHE